MRPVCMSMSCLCRVGQDREHAPYMTLYLVLSLPKIPYLHCIYKVLANPMYMRVYDTPVVFSSKQPKLSHWFTVCSLQCTLPPNTVIRSTVVLAVGQDKQAAARQCM